MQITFLDGNVGSVASGPLKLLPFDDGSDGRSDAASVIEDTARSTPELQQQNLSESSPLPREPPTMQSEHPSTPAGQFLAFSHAYKTSVFSAISRLQSSPITPSRTGLRYWKTSRMQRRTFCSSLEVREDTALRMFIEYSPLTLDRTSTDFFSGKPLAALTTLSFSDNIDLQRSAALAFAEVTEKVNQSVGRETLDPIIFLLGSPVIDIQCAASCALGNLAVNGGCF